MITPKSMDLLEAAFPELPKKQLEVSILYSLGTANSVIAEYCHISPETVRTYLKRSVKSLNIESQDALRTAILLRTFLIAINK